MASKSSPKQNHDKKKHTGKNIEEQVYEYAHEKILNWILKNLKMIGIVVGIIVLTAIIVLSWRAYQTGLTEKALALEGKAFALHQEVQTELADANQQADSETPSDAENAYQEVIPLYEEILDQYPGTQSAARAYFLLGSIAYQQARYDEAQAYFSTYLKKYSEGSLAIQAEESLGYIQEQQQNYQKALDIFNTLEAKVSESRKPAILLAMARNYEALEQPQDAISTYQRVIDSNTSFSLKNTARERLDILQAAQRTPAEITAAPQEQPAADASEEQPTTEQPTPEEPVEESPAQEAQPTASPQPAAEETPAAEESSGETGQQTETTEQPAEQETPQEETSEETH